MFSKSRQSDDDLVTSRLTLALLAGSRSSFAARGLRGESLLGLGLRDLLSSFTTVVTLFIHVVSLSTDDGVLEIGDGGEHNSEDGIKSFFLCRSISGHHSLLSAFYSAHILLRWHALTTTPFKAASKSIGVGSEDDIVVEVL